MVDDGKRKALELEHEHYLSEFKILLTAIISIVVGLIIAIATGNIKAQIFGNDIIVVSIVGAYGFLLVIFVIMYYRRRLDEIREKLTKVK